MLAYLEEGQSIKGLAQWLKMFINIYIALSLLCLEPKHLCSNHSYDAFL